MTGSELTGALRAMGIDEWCPQMMSLWPYVELAWTDHRVSDETRRRIVERVRRRRSVGHSGLRTLEGWLGFRPSDRYLARGRDVARALIHRADPQADDDPEDLIAFCQDLAAETARVFGVEPCPVPAEILLELAELLDVSPGIAWTEVDAQVGQTVVMPSPFADLDLGNPEGDHDFDIPHGLLRWSDAPAEPRRRLPSGTAALIQWSREGEGSAWEVQGEILTIGRGPDNDVVLQDGRVSRHHCRLVRRGPSWFIVDNDSANGTHVNGEFVVEAELFGGERIAIGGGAFVFRLGPAPGG